MKNSWCKRLIALTLAVLMALSLSACSSRNDSGQDISQSGGFGSGLESDQGNALLEKYVYVPEFTELKNAVEADFINSLLMGDSLYYVSLQYHAGDERASQFICEYSLSQERVLQEMFVSDRGMNIDDFCVSGDGSIYTVLLEDRETSTGIERVSMLIAFDSQGNQKWEKDLTEYGARSAQVKVTVDGENRVYIFAPGGGAAWFDEQGNPLGQMQLEDTVMASGIGRDGKVYVTYYDKTGESVLAELDIERGETAQLYENFPNSLINRLIPGTEQDFLVADWQGHLYGYDLESQTAEEIFSWMDYDISYLTVGGYWPAEDGGVTALLQSVSPGQVDLVRLERRDPASVPQKTEIVVAVLGDWGDLPREIAVFNRQSEDCHVTYRQYHADSFDMLSDAVTKLNIDLVSRDNCPDIIVLDSSINVEALAGNGVFADLSVYLEQSSALKREDYPENILDCFTFQGVLTGIPLTFTLSTVAGRGADLGDESGWTLDEMIAYGEKHPDAKLFYDNDRYSMYYKLMNFGQSRFIDQQERSCSFNSDEFKSLFSYIAMYPEPDYNNYPSFSARQIQNGEVLLHETSISAYQDIQLYDGLFGGEAVFIGYPTPDGSNGCRLYTSNVYGITARSEKKDEAWRFIEFFLSEDPEVWGYSGLPSNTEERLARAVETQYVRDQFGRFWIGSEGKPVERYSTVVYSGVEYEYHPVTEEEIARLEELVDTAQVVFSADAEISRVLSEETRAFFSGQRSVDDVAQVIQNRVQLFLNGN